MAKPPEGGLTRRSVRNPRADLARKLSLLFAFLVRPSLTRKCSWKLASPLRTHGSHRRSQAVYLTAELTESDCLYLHIWTLVSEPTSAKEG